MGRLPEITRTAAFAWSPDAKSPSLVTGTKSGAVEADFSNDTRLELWDMHLGNDGSGTELHPVAAIDTEKRFYGVAWSEPSTAYPHGVIAGALEDGSLNLWDAAKLRRSQNDLLVARTTQDGFAIKALQFNPHKLELLATCGERGELYLTDLNDAAHPVRVGATAVRAENFDCLDWNKKVPHILVTGGSGGFVTVWDVKTKKESLTLNNYGRKPVSAVAWNPDVPTKLATAVPTDQDPLILLWDLRNSSAPERILKGHEQGVLSLAWCPQDSELLLSCGKDNRSLCWNPQTGHVLGEFPIVMNWTFQTSWNPRHPNFLATASLDGKITVSALQNTSSTATASVTAPVTAADGEEFFDKAQIDPRGVSFSLSQPPKWLRRPFGVSFGYGGKIARLAPMNGLLHASNVIISRYVSDTDVESSIVESETTLRDENLTKLCDSRLAAAQSEEAKQEWQMMRTLVSDSPRKHILEYLGFWTSPSDNAQDTMNTEVEFKQNGLTEANGTADVTTANRRISALFDSSGAESGFLTALTASKGARTNNPFRIFTSSDSTADQKITRALMLGSFKEALGICLEEKRMSDAFMIAICGGQTCIEKVQAAYFSQSNNAPNYLRLLMSIADKNLWDVVHNAELDNWAAIMAMLCTYADETEFADLCEALGDRLEEFQESRRNALFCYLAGSKLEKIVPIWIRDMQDAEHSHMRNAKDESEFTIHVQALQSFIEKVFIFRRGTAYQDKDYGLEQKSDWKLGPLYAMYLEYADVVATQGHLDLAQRYLDLLPKRHPAVEVAQTRVRQAVNKTISTSNVRRAQHSLQGLDLQSQERQNVRSLNHAQPLANTPGVAFSHGAASTPDLSAPPQQFGRPYIPSQGTTTAYQTNPHSLAPQASQANVAPAAGPPRPKSTDINWNDLPQDFASMPPTSRRGTPGPRGPITQPTTNPFPPTTMPNSHVSSQYSDRRPPAPLPPPPKAGSRPPRTSSPLVDRQNPESRQPPPVPSPTSFITQQPSLSNPYNTQQLPQSVLPTVTGPMARSSSPYSPAPMSAPPSSRYLPQSGTPNPPTPLRMSGLPSSKPTAPPPSSHSSTHRMSDYQPIAGQVPPVNLPIQTSSSSSITSNGPPLQHSRSGGNDTWRNAPQSMMPAPPKPPAEDRSDRPMESMESMAVVQILGTEMQRIKRLAPTNYKAQVDDTEKRLNILFETLNQKDVLKSEDIRKLDEIAHAIQTRDFEKAQSLHTELMERMQQAGPWVVGLKRLIAMSRATPVR